MSIVAIAATVIAAGSIFSSCKKDAANTIADSKSHSVRMMGTTTTVEDLREFEKYTPAESLVKEKLLRFTKYVNEASDNPMPNMEIKEAIWLMETFFNIGVCEKQKQFVDYTYLKKSYQMDIPLCENIHTETVEGEDGNQVQVTTITDGIFLNGVVLQEAYHKLLVTIVTEICPEYAMNFGDVYVSSITTSATGGGMATVNIDVMYGEPCRHEYEGRYKIIEPNQAAIYPTTAPNPDVFMLSKFRSIGSGQDPWLDIPYSGMRGYCRDPYMENILNRNFTQQEVINIIHCKNERFSQFTLSPLGVSDSYACSGSGAALGSCSCRWIIHKHASYYGCSFHERVYETITFPAQPATPLLTKSEYENFGALYIDYIYANLCNNIPQGYEPLYAACFHVWDQSLALGNFAMASWQHFGVEYIAQFVKNDNPYYAELCIHMILFKTHEVMPYLQSYAM
jgi:hypothetical protein